MAVTHKDFNIDGLIGRIYDFTEVGDGIPRHTHRREDSHLSIVTNGKFRMGLVNKAGEEELSIAEPGRVMNYPVGVEHWSDAVEVPARMVFVFRFHVRPGWQYDTRPGD